MSVKIGMMQNNMKVIGLTGSIGSGKSTVAAILSENGAYIIDADKVGHELYYKRGPAWEALIAAFGDEVLDDDGNIDRSKLAAMVFRDNERLSILNAIVHPLIKQEVSRRLNNARQAGIRLAIVEAALLIEAGWHEMVDEVWLVTADEEVRLRRIMQRNGISADEARRRVQSQIPDAEKAKYADIIIANNGSIDDLKRKVEEVLKREGG